jgi:hypothetical protein
MMVDTITLYSDKQALDIPFTRQLLSKQQLQQAVQRLKRFSLQDEESTFYLALMKLIQELPDTAIHDAFYEKVKKVLEQAFMLFRYYDEGERIKHPNYPNYRTQSLFSTAASKDYLQSWTKLPSKSGIHPASLFAAHVLKDDAEDRPLRFLSYCRDPFCSLMSLTFSQENQYIERLFDTIDAFAKKMPPTGPLTYVGFASGQFGRDALRLDLLKYFLDKHHKKLTNINLLFIDPFYANLTASLEGDAVDLKTSAQALLVKKSIIDLANFAKNRYDLPIQISLFPSIDAANKYAKADIFGPTFLFAEDYFINDVEKGVVNDVEACRDMIQKNNTEQAPFDFFLTYKNKEKNILHIDCSLPKYATSAQLQTLDPYRS